METLKQLLSDRKIAQPKNLADIVKGYGYDPEKLTPEDAKAIADEMGKAATATAIATRTKSNGNGKAATSDEGLKKALLHAFSQKQKELEAFEGQLGKHREQWIVNWVERNMNDIRSTSTDAFELLKAELLKEEANADNFLRTANELAQELFAADGSTLP